LFDEMVQQHGGFPPIYGPASVMMVVPEALACSNRLYRYLREESSLSMKTVELATIVAARELDCRHVWNAHAGAARQYGNPDSLVDGLRDRLPLHGLAPDEQAVVQFGQEYFRTHRVSPEVFQAALDQFGQRGLTELAFVFGSYSLVSVIVNTFETDMPPAGNEPLLPV
jgi:4-carboxymuconolactone decarboxylase